MKNEINMGQFQITMGFCGNGWKNASPVSINMETGSHKYGNRWNKIENGTGRNKIFFPSVNM
jgi:hypothetical protein